MGLTFTSQGFRGGIWSGRLTGGTPARAVLVLRGETVAEAVLTPDDGGLTLEARLPADRLGEGAQSFLLIADSGEGMARPLPGGVTLASLPVVAGAPLADDLAAEIALLRAELDLLKRELRRLATGA